MKKTNNRFPFFDLLLTSLTILLIGTSAYLLFIYNSDSSASSPVPIDPKEISSTIDEIESNFSGIKIVTEISNDAHTPFAIQYPQSAHMTFNDQLKKYIERLKYDYLTMIAEYKQQQDEVQSELNISFETFQHPNGMYSFVLVNNASFNEEDGFMDIQTFHLNPETGEMPSFDEAFQTTDEAMQKISEIAATYLTKENEMGASLSEEEIAALTAPDAKNFEQFALTEDLVIFYFTKHQKGENTPIISMPYDAVNDLLAADFQIGADIAQKPNEGQAEKEEKEAPNKDTQTEEADKQTDNLKKVALTFDDGPDPKVTTRILDTLAKYDAKATFFMLGSRVEYYPEIAKLVQEAGHELGNHSWTHPDLSKASTDKVFNEINRTSQIIEEVTGEKPYSFRPPYGAFNDLVKAQTDLPIALWDVDTLDWKHRNGQQLLTYVKNSVRDGSIILMHDIHPSTADGLDAVMAYLQENGYTFVPVSDLID